MRIPVCELLISSRNIIMTNENVFLFCCVPQVGPSDGVSVDASISRLVSGLVVSPEARLARGEVCELAQRSGRTAAARLDGAIDAGPPVSLHSGPNARGAGLRGTRRALHRELLQIRQPQRDRRLLRELHAQVHF